MGELITRWAGSHVIVDYGPDTRQGTEILVLKEVL
jgi:hypothetical protein